jgi:hypothetical protein
VNGRVHTECTLVCWQQYYSFPYCAGKNKKYTGIPVPLTKIRMLYHQSKLGVSLVSCSLHSIICIMLYATIYFYKISLYSFTLIFLILASYALFSILVLWHCFISIKSHYIRFSHTMHIIICMSPYAFHHISPNKCICESLNIILCFTFLIFQSLIHFLCILFWVTNLNYC